jgi:subtilase family serine protease
MSIRTSSSSSRRPAVAAGIAAAALGATALVGATVAPSASAAPTASSGASGAVSYTGVKAAESAFHAAIPGDPTPAACTRPAPDNRVSAYVHCYGPDDLRTFYGLGPLASSNDGAGQTIVLVDSYGSPTAANDLAFYAKTFGGPTPDFEAVFPGGTPNTAGATGNGNGRSGPTAAEGWAGEANLDIEWAYAMAPKAHIVLIGTPPAETQGVQGLPNLMKAIDWGINTYPAGTVFSMSFGTDESAFGSSSAAKSQFARFDQTFQRGQAKGDTFFASSGDNGSVGVTRAHQQTATSPDPQVSYPNVSPYVTSVGGTQVQSGWTWAPTQDKPFLADGSRNPLYWAWNSGGSTEPVWNESWAGIATGGGLSTVYARPTFQNSVAGVVGNHRGVPDLSWNAAVNGGVLTYRSFFPAIDGAPSWAVYGGTSAASPQAAAMTAIANQARKAAGKAPIGDLNKAIYGTTAVQTAGFRDIVPVKDGTTPSGNLHNNRIWDIGADGFVTPDPVVGYPTTAGYDLTTGWGSPLAPGYVSTLTALK